MRQSLTLLFFFLLGLALVWLGTHLAPSLSPDPARGLPGWTSPEGADPNAGRTQWDSVVLELVFFNHRGRRLEVEFRDDSGIVAVSAFHLNPGEAEQIRWIPLPRAGWDSLHLRLPQAGETLFITGASWLDVSVNPKASHSIALDQFQGTLASLEGLGEGVWLQTTEALQLPNLLVGTALQSRVGVGLATKTVLGLILGGIFFGLWLAAREEPSALSRLMLPVVSLWSSSFAFLVGVPRMPINSIDDSFPFAINEGLARGLFPGIDLIFTFGPLSALWTRQFHPINGELVFYLSLFMTVLGAWLWVRITAPLRSRMKWALLMLPPLFTFSFDFLLLLYPLLFFLAVFVRTETKSLESPGDLSRATWFWLVPALPLALIVLVKANIGAASVGVVGLVGLLLLSRWRMKPAIIFGITFLGALIVFWMSTGSPFPGLIGYFAGLLPIIDGYTSAMFIWGRPENLILASLAFGIILLSVLFLPALCWRRRAFYFLGVAGISFVAYKASFVRHDQHEQLAFALISFLSIWLIARHRLRAVWLALFIGLFLEFKGQVLDRDYPFRQSHLASRIPDLYTTGMDAVQVRILDRTLLTQRYHQALFRLREHNPLPGLTGSVDVYNTKISHLLAHGLDYNPRPVMQSYSAYNARLAEGNLQHLLSAEGPEFLLWEINSIDDRLVAVDDGPSWAVFLQHFSPLTFSGYYLVAGRNRAGALPEPVYRELKTIEFSFDEVIELPNDPALIFAQFDIPKSGWGRLLEFLFKPPALYLEMLTGDTLVGSSRLPPRMADSPFLLNPRVNNAYELAGLWNTDQTGTAFDRFRLSISHRFFYREPLRVTFLALESPETSYLESLDSLSKGTPSDQLTIVDRNLYSSVDIFFSGPGRFPPAPGRVILFAEGWLQPLPESIHVGFQPVALAERENHLKIFPLDRTLRQDAAQFLRLDNPYVGFRGFLNLPAPGAGWRLSLGYQRGNQIIRLREFHSFPE